MKPLTPSLLDDCVASVVGMPYKACKHAGVMRVLHDAGTASLDRFTAGMIPLGMGIEASGARES